MAFMPLSVMEIADYSRQLSCACLYLSQQKEQWRNIMSSYLYACPDTLKSCCKQICGCCLATKKELLTEKGGKAYIVWSVGLDKEDKGSSLWRTGFLQASRIWGVPLQCRQSKTTLPECPVLLDLVFQLRCFIYTLLYLDPVSLKTHSSEAGGTDLHKLQGPKSFQLRPNAFGKLRVQDDQGGRNRIAFPYLLCKTDKALDCSADDDVVDQSWVL